jgi:hypothetical protein
LFGVSDGTLTRIGEPVKSGKWRRRKAADCRAMHSGCAFLSDAA